jgi:hypothetical protein
MQPARSSLPAVVRPALRRCLPVLALALLVACGGTSDGGGGSPRMDAAVGSDGINLGGDAYVPGRPDLGGGERDVAAPPDAPAPPDVPSVVPDVPDVPAAPDVPTPPRDVPAPPRDVPQPPACGYGDVVGVVCSPSGTVYINDALVYVETTDCNGQPLRVETTSNALGEWTLTGVPSGTQTVELRKGAFQHSLEVPVQPNTLTDLRSTQAKLCFGARAARIAVVSSGSPETGTYDSIQLILDDLGIEYDLFDDTPPLFGGVVTPAAAFLRDPAALGQYHLIFLNCSEWAWITLYGAGAATATQIANNLSAFVHNGGSLYASDWAFAYVERPWPGLIDFVGNDAVQFDPKVGEIDMYTASVRDASLAAYLGKDEVRINFDLMQWVVMQSVAGSATTHIEARIPQAGGIAPLMVSFKPYQLGGTVLFTSFHNEQQATQDMENILNFLVFSL